MSEVLRGALLEQQEETQKDKFLTFTLGKEYYGIEIKYVTEIIGIQPITEVPELPGAYSRNNQFARQDNPCNGCKTKI